MDKTVEEIFDLFVEQSLLTDAKKLYGMDIEPRGREIYFKIKGMSGPIWDEAYTSYLNYSNTDKYKEDWKKSKMDNGLKESR